MARASHASHTSPGATAATGGGAVCTPATLSASDSLPVPIMGCHLLPSVPSAATWQGYGATFGKIPTKLQTGCGDTLHLLVTRNGVIRDRAVVAVSACDGMVSVPLLREREERSRLVTRRHQRPAGCLTAVRARRGPAAP